MPNKTRTDYERWVIEAAKVERDDNPLNIPYDVALTEAVQVAGFLNKCWEPAEGRPGLQRVKARLPRSTASDIVSLVGAVQQAQTNLLLILDPSVVDLGPRAREVIDTLEAALEFLLLDDDIEEPADAQLARIQGYHSQDAERSTTLAQALRDFAALAATLQDRLVECDEEFDPKLIKEAEKLAQSLSTQGATPAAESDESRKATKIRNQLLHLLVKKVSLVRRAAAHVFRAHPVILREATSAYERRRRAANRRAKLAKEAEAAKAAAEAKKGGG